MKMQAGEEGGGSLGLEIPGGRGSSRPEDLGGGMGGAMMRELGLMSHTWS